MTKQIISYVNMSMFLEATRIPSTSVSILIYNPIRDVIKKYGERLNKKLLQ